MVHQKKIKEIIIENCDWVEKDKIKEDTKFSQLGFDSMDAASIMLGIEEFYSIKIPNDEIHKLDSIQSISIFLQNKNIK
jgi:acyl carrier protein